MAPVTEKRRVQDAALKTTRKVALRGILDDWLGFRAVNQPWRT
jgi:hypothetical protein